MILTESPLLRPAVAQKYSTYQKHSQAGDQDTLTHGIESHHTSTTERGQYTPPQQENYKHLHKQPFTQKIAPRQLKQRFTQQHE